MSADGDPASDEQIRAVVARLSRPCRGGGRVIEHAAILAEGSTASAILEWITASSWEPEELVATTAHRGGAGVHGMGRGGEALRARAPRRYILPPDDVD